MARVARGLERGDDERMLAPRALGSARDDEVELELLAQLLGPLLAQRRRREHERGADLAAQQVLLEDDAGLDRLAESDLVGEERAPAQVAHHLQRRLELVREALDAAQRVERQEPVGRRPRREPLGAIAGGEAARDCPPRPPAQRSSSAVPVSSRRHSDAVET